MKVEGLGELEMRKIYSILCEISMELTSPAPLDQVLEKTADLLARVFYPDRIRIYLWDDEASELRLKVWRGLSEEFLKQVQEIPLGTGYSGAALERGEPFGMNVSEFTDQHRKAMFRKEGIKSVLAIPLILKGCTLGVLNVASTRDYDFFSDKLDFLYAVGSQISIAINSARLFEQKIEQERLKATIELERTLAQVQKLAAVGEIVSKIGHELRTSLTIVGGFAQRMIKTCPPEEKKHLDIVLSEVSRLENILSSLVGYIGEEFHPEKIDVNQLIGDSLQLFTDQCEKKHIVIQKSLDETLPQIFADPKQIRQVLISIIKNNLDVIPDNGVISVKTQVEDKSAQIFIEDTGPKIPQEDLIRLFCSFVTGRPRGVGLGLTIAKRIIEAHKGTFSVANKEKEGVIYQINLPLD
jgi:signal transduction histidine kinase